MNSIIDEIEHPIDRIGATDPALVDLSSYREAAQAKRDNDDRERLREKQRTQRERYNEQMRPAAPAQMTTPREIMQVSDAEKLLSQVAGGIL